MTDKEKYRNALREFVAEHLKAGMKQNLALFNSKLDQTLANSQAAKKVNAELLKASMKLDWARDNYWKIYWDPAAPGALRARAKNEWDKAQAEYDEIDAKWVIINDEYERLKAEWFNGNA